MSTLKSHYSAQELAAMNLPGMPKTKKGFLDRADREKWTSRPRSGRGGGLEYAPPKEVMALIQAQLAKKVAKQAPALPAPTSSEVAPVPPSAPAQVCRAGGLIRRLKREEDLTTVDRDRRDASLVLCRAIEDGIQLTGYKARRIIIELAGQIMAGMAHEVVIAAAQTTYTKPRKNGQTEAALVSRLQKMYAAYQQGIEAGDPGLYLVPGKIEKRGHTPADIHAFLTHFCRPTRPPVMEAWRQSEGWYASHGLTRPAVDTWYRIEKELPVTLKYRGRMTGSAFKSLLPYVKRDVSAFKSNDIWVGDGHTFKAKIQHPIHGRPFPPEVTIVLDWVSRKIVGWSVDLAENQLAVSGALRHAHQTTRARPLIYYSDNGSGQTAKSLDHEVSGTLTRLGIAHETGIPGNPQGRGVIERLWQTVTYPLARTYPTYQGKTGDQETIRKMLQALNRKDGSAERLLPSFGQFLADLEAAINHYNANHQHRELDGMTPNEAYLAKLDPESADLGITDQELAAMWLPGEVRSPQRGVVSLFGNEYACAHLVHTLREGEKVLARYDIHNAERIWLSTLDGKYLGAADWNAHKRAAFPVAFVDQLREARAEGKIKRAERDIAEARAELGNTIEQEELVPFRFEAPAPEPELVDFTPQPVQEEEREISYMETMAMLRKHHEENQRQEEAGEVAAR